MSVENILNTATYFQNDKARIIYLTAVSKCSNKKAKNELDQLFLEASAIDFEKQLSIEEAEYALACLDKMSTLFTHYKFADIEKTRWMLKLKPCTSINGLRRTIVFDDNYANFIFFGTIHTKVKSNYYNLDLEDMEILNPGNNSFYFFPEGISIYPDHALYPYGHTTNLFPTPSCSPKYLYENEINSAEDKFITNSLTKYILSTKTPVISFDAIISTDSPKIRQVFGTNTTDFSGFISYLINLSGSFITNSFTQDDLESVYYIHIRNALAAYKLLRWTRHQYETTGEKPIVATTFGASHFNLAFMLIMGEEYCLSELKNACEYFKIDGNKLGDFINLGFVYTPDSCTKYVFDRIPKTILAKNIGRPVPDVYQSDMSDTCPVSLGESKDMVKNKLGFGESYTELDSTSRVRYENIGMSILYSKSDNYSFVKGFYSTRHKIGGIPIGCSIPTLYKMLGKPDDILPVEQNKYIIYSYYKKGLQFVIDNNKVIASGRYDFMDIFGDSSIVHLR